MCSPCPPSHEGNLSRSRDRSKECDLYEESFGIGGGDLYIAELVQAARSAGHEIREMRSRRTAPESERYRPPGYAAPEG